MTADAHCPLTISPGIRTGRNTDAEMTIRGRRTPHTDPETTETWLWWKLRLSRATHSTRERSGGECRRDGIGTESLSGERKPIGVIARSWGSRPQSTATTGAETGSTGTATAIDTLSAAGSPMGRPMGSSALLGGTGTMGGGGGGGGL